jgi:hypothetical protein
MAGMKPLRFVRKHQRAFVFLTVFAALCYAVLRKHDPTGLVLLAGAVILIVIFFYPSKRGPKPKRRKFRPPPPRKKTKKYLDFN